MARLFRITLVFAATLVALAGAAAAQDGLKGQFTIVLPEGWTVYDHEAALAGRPGIYGIVFFSAEPVMAPAGKMPDPDALEAPREVFLSERFPKGRKGRCTAGASGATAAPGIAESGSPTSSRATPVPARFSAAPYLNLLR